MSLPKPQVGLVIKYSFLWSHEAEAGRTEGSKDRPCAIVVVLLREGKKTIVRVLPITHTLPGDPASAMEIPPKTKANLGLDADKSWVILDEANDFVWPGTDLRPRVAGNWQSSSYGMLPKAFMKLLKVKFLKRHQDRRTKTVRR